MDSYKVIVNGKPLADLTPAERERFDRRKAGRLKEMLASGRPPLARTDDTFMAGNTNGSQFENKPMVGDRYAQMAAAAGVNVTGKKYLEGLAAFPGDPQAWVNGRADVQRVCEERGWDCSGAVTVKGREFNHPEGPALAPDIVAAEVAERMAQDPGLTDAAGVAEQVVADHAPHWSKGA